MISTFVCGHRRLLAGLAGLALLPSLSASAQEAVCPVYRYSPARVFTVFEQVLERPATRIVERRAAVYRTITERILLQPRRRIVSSQPAVFRTVAETFLVKPAMQVERYVPPIRGEIRRNGVTYARNRSGAWVVVLRPAQTVLDASPATYATRARRVLLRGMQAIVRSFPAVYGTRTRTVEVSPERYGIETLPARYRTISHQVSVDPPRLRLTFSEANCSYGGPRLVGPAENHPYRWGPGF